MEPKFAAQYRHFTMVTPHETKIVRPRAIPYGSYDEDTAASRSRTDRTGTHGRGDAFDADRFLSSLGGLGTG